MQIQGSINSLLTLAGTAAALSPELEKQAELRKVKKQQEIEELKKEISLESVSATSGKPEAKEHFAEFLKSKEHVTDLARQQFELNPTEETYQNYMQNQKKATQMSKLYNLMYKKDKAQDSLQTRQAEISKQPGQSDFFTAQKNSRVSMSDIPSVLEEINK